MIDRRLIGTWKSDRRLTAKDIAARRDIPTAKVARLARIFGHLTLRYTPTRCYSQFHEGKDVRSYRVLAKTADSVVVRSRALAPETFTSVYHLRFTEVGPSPSVYWISLGAFREFFRRVKKGRDARAKAK